MISPRVYIIFLFVQFFIASCCFCDDEIAVIETEKPILTFAVAGHVYGNSMTFTSSIYPPFLKKLKEDNEKYNFDYLFLTGDVVPHSTDSNWSVVMNELERLNINWIVAPGNHDLGLGYVPLSKRMEELYGSTSGPYHQIREKKNQIFVLNTSYPGWTLDSIQLDYVEYHLSKCNEDDNIFVFTHQLWWQKNAPIEFDLDSIKPNSYAAFDGKSTFWEDAFPLFDSLQNEIYFFAGDIGAHQTVESYYEDHYKNFHFYGSGMGGGLEDNYLIVSVYENGAVEIERVDF